MKKDLTIVIATYNSSNRIQDLFTTISNQILEDYTFEILIIDGNSTDNTREIAAKNNWSIYENRNGDPVSAKMIGVIRSNSRYIAFLDHDESFAKLDSLYRKIRLMDDLKNINIVFPEGYQTDISYSNSNLYTTLFGDPLSRFLYDFPNNINRTILMRKRLRSLEYQDFLLFTNDHTLKKSVLLETSSMGVVIRTDFIKSMCVSSSDLPHLFYLGKCDDDFTYAILKNDPIKHASSENWKEIMKKISWRIENFVLDPRDIQKSGIRGRASYEFKKRNQRFFNWSTLRFLLFLIEILLVLPIFLRSSVLALRYKRFGFLMEFTLIYFIVFKSINVIARKIMLLKFSNQKSNP